MSPCLYCKGSGLMRHERPFDLSDEGWERLGAGKCPLCRGAGVYEAPPGANTGVLFCSTRGGRALAACPAPDCRNWVDVTHFFNGIVRESFEGKCEDSHSLSMEVNE